METMSSNDEEHLPLSDGEVPNYPRVHIVADLCPHSNIISKLSLFIILISQYFGQVI